MNTFPYWFEDGNPARYPKLESAIKVDVLIVGGGIAGVTAAYLLASEGFSVALVEREKLGGRDTGHTTAHLTYMTDTRLCDLTATFSRNTARLAWEAGREAMEFIAGTVDGEAIDCLFETAPGYLAAAEGLDLQEEASLLQHEALVATQLGFDARWIERSPVTSRPGILFNRQAKFHPIQYIDGLGKRAVDKGARIFEDTGLTGFSKEAGEATAGGHNIGFRHVFIATHVPLQGDASTVGAASFQTKLALYSTYAIGAAIPKGVIPPMIWSDTADPFLYLRVESGDDADYCILGGEDHRTGQEEDTVTRYRRLEAQLGKWFPGAEVKHRWSGQVVETIDGLPFIGPTSDQQFIATGFSGNGMTFGTIAALMFRDHVQELSNRYAGIFDPGRKTASAFSEFFRENKDYPVRMIMDRLRVEEGDPGSLAPGEAKVMECKGQRVAAYRAPDGELAVRTAICPHLGCIVAWNSAEATWDCPCHGSRFKATGEVIAGPAEKDLAAVQL